MKLSDKAKWGIRIAYNALVSVMLVVTGVLFAYECYLIYKSGPSPFTRESIAEAFSHISVMTYITISLVVIGAGLHIFIYNTWIHVRDGICNRIGLQNGI